MKRLLLIILAFLSLSVLTRPMVRGAEQEAVDVYLFSRQGCPHCADLKHFLKRQADFGLPINLIEYDVLNNQETGLLFEKVGKAFGVQLAGVPFTVVGDEYQVGYGDDETSGAALMAIIKSKSLNPGVNVVSAVISDDSQLLHLKKEIGGRQDKKTLAVPNSAWALLVFTATIGLLDSFNPCAMWVLLLLIGLLFRLENSRRQWLLGGAFIGASALAYFLFLVAWFNIYDLLKVFDWLRWSVGGLAVYFGLNGLYRFFLARQGCEVEVDDKKHRLIVRSVKYFAQKNNFLIALAGLAFIGVGVNLIELFCSAGLPAAYVPVLTAADLASWQYYAHLWLYVFFYILPQLIIFLLAIFTMKRFGISSKISKWFGLASALLLLLLGLVMIIKPEYLAFNF